MNSDRFKKHHEPIFLSAAAVHNLYLSMERFAAKVRQLVTSEDGPTSTEYAVVLVLLSILGFVVYRLLQDGLF